MINNKCMKNWYFLFLILFFMSSSSVLAMPDYDKNDNTPIIYDVTYNVNLRNKLEDDYHKKYTVKVDDNHYLDTAPMDAYEKEVVIPYALNKKRWQDTIITK